MTCLFLSVSDLVVFRVWDSHGINMPSHFALNRHTMALSFFAITSGHFIALVDILTFDSQIHYMSILTNGWTAFRLISLNGFNHLGPKIEKES